MISIRFQIAKLIFEIQVSNKVKVTEEFVPFVCSEMQNSCDCMTRFEQIDDLNLRDGIVVAQHTSFEVCSFLDGTWERRYTDSSDRDRHFVATSIMLSNNLNLVKILPVFSKKIVDTGHLFFYVAMEEQLLRHGRWIVHASCVKTPLGTILFVGPSGAGKTTQAELWEKYRGSKVLNGDRTIVYEKDGVWYAAGSPYAGSSKRYVNESAPISLVVLLEQGTENRVQALTPGQAFRSLYPHLTVNDWNPWYVETITDQLDQFVRERPVVHFSCTPDEAAVEALWSKLAKEDHCG